MNESLNEVEIQVKFDLEWDDSGVMPEVVNPDMDFLFRRMNEATYEQVDAKQGEMILDIGCGRAIDGVELAKRGAAVIGLEPSKVMMAHARSHINGNGTSVALVYGVGEYLPLGAQSVDKVLCKGALDHFPDPAMVIRQMGTVLKPGGKAIIAIANFESLGFRLGKKMHQFKRVLGFKDGRGRKTWEIPSDHTYKFDYSLIRQLANDHLEVEKATGVSLFFGLPLWGVFLAKCPRKFSLFMLKTLDKMARRLPTLSDVVILKCKRKE
jgi:SAM-dependent methyltransferase